MEIGKNAGGVKELFLIALPMVISFGCDTVMTFTDRLFLSKLGPEYMNAAMAGGLACFLVMTFFIGILGYVTAFVAQNLGADKKDHCSLAITQGIIISIVGYILILLAKPFLLVVLGKLKIDSTQLVYQKEFFSLIIYSILFALLRANFGSFFSGIGKTRTVMTASVATMIINVILNYLLVFGNFGFPKLGIKGSALSTVISSFFGVLILVIIYLKRKNVCEYKINESFRFDKHVMKTILKFGLPSGIELFLIFFAFNILVFVFQSQGEITATAATIMFNWDLVAFVPLLGFSIGVTSLVGRYIGANRIDLVKKSVISGLKLSMCYSLIVFVFFVFFTRMLVNVFRPFDGVLIFDKNVMPISLNMIKIAAIYVLTDAQMIVFSAALRGTGDTFFVMIISMFVNWTLCLSGFLLMKIFHVPTLHSWLIMVIIFASLSTLFYFRYRTEKWVNINKFL